MESVSIVFRNPSLDVPDFVEVFDRGLSISNVKSRLSHVYPSKPAVECQKLFLSGRLLRDGDTLVGLGIKDHDVVHIVVPRITKQQLQEKRVEETKQKDDVVVENGDTLPKQEELVQEQQQQQQEQQEQQQEEQQVVVEANVPPLNVGLLFRLGFVVVVLAQGGDSSRALVLVLLAFFAYLWQTRRIPMAFPALYRNNQDGVGPSIFAEIYDLIVPLVLSLVPTWRTDAYLNGGNVEQPLIPPEDDDEDQ